MSKTPLNRCSDDRGAALVEFALVFPLIMMLLLGMVSAGLAWNEQLQLTHATREAARYGATVPRDQVFSPPSTTWADAVMQVALARGGSDLDVNGATICVALVQGSGGTLRVVGTPAVPGSPSSNYVKAGTRNSGAWSYSNNGTLPCIAGETYPVTDADDGRRVQVTMSRPGNIDAIFYSTTLTLTASASAKAESTA
jgi:Flp pilus assembly protein TadG